ncbi:MAG: apolipoprotein N-acyltransferase [Candidatus Kapaibacterium sp.]|jgi:apolipoprotein N-acyltransferase
MKQLHTHPFLVVAAAGLCAGFGFAPAPFGVLAFVAFVPLILVLEKFVNHGRYSWLLYTFFFCFHGAANWWVMSWQKETDPYLMIAGAGLWLGHPFFLMPAFWMYRAVRKRQTIAVSLLFLAVAWTACEWLHSLSDLSYPWLALGYTQIDATSLVQIADVGGVWLVSLLVIGINTVTAYMVLVPERQRASILRLSAVVCLCLAYGKVRELSLQHADTPTLRVGVVQPSINPWVKWQGGIYDMFNLHRNLQDSVNRVSQCDLSVWSETALPVGLRRTEYSFLQSEIHDWVQRSNMSLLTGCVEYTEEPDKSTPGYTSMRVYNSAFIYNPGTTDIPTHHKSRLTPFGEYMPFSDDVPAIRSWLRWGVGISGWNKGAGATVLPVLRGTDTLARVGPVICIESIYPGYVADYVRRGADVLAVITNDAWYDGTFGPRQHYCISRMRAIETRRDIVRCGNTGISGCISRTGASYSEAPARARTALAGAVHLYNDQSIYVLVGDWVPWLCALLSACIGVWTWRSGRSRLE